MTEQSISITDATVWTGSADQPGLFTKRTISIADGRITAIEPTTPGDEEADIHIDGSSLLVTPGLIDAHAHTGHRLSVGFAQDVPELQWMDQALGPMARATSHEDRLIASKLAVLESIRSGVTTICEYGTEVTSILEAVHLPAGMRAVGVETINEIVDRPEDGPYELDRSASESARNRTATLFDTAEEHERLTAMYGPQALDMVTPTTMDEIIEQARKEDAKVHIHLAQGGRERRQLQDRYGVDSAVSLLQERDWLDECFVGAHLHGATPQQRRSLAAAGASMVGCPSSIGAIDGIIPPIAEYREFGGTVAIGTDQAPGGAGGHHLLSELRQAWLFAKVEHGDPTAMSVWEVLSLGTIGGANALGVADEVGTLEAGKRADLACFDLDSLSLTPTSAEVAATPLTALISSGGRTTATHVIVGGEFIRRDGEFVTLDADTIYSQAREHASELQERGAPDWFEAGSALVDAVESGPFGVDHPDGYEDQQR